MDSFWKELNGTYICNCCDFESKEPVDKCPICQRKMLGIQKEFGLEELFYKFWENK